MAYENNDKEYASKGVGTAGLTPASSAPFSVPESSTTVSPESSAATRTRQQARSISCLRRTTRSPCSRPSSTATTRRSPFPKGWRTLKPRLSQSRPQLRSATRFSATASSTSRRRFPASPYRWCRTTLLLRATALRSWPRCRLRSRPSSHRL